MTITRLGHILRLMMPVFLVLMISAYNAQARNIPLPEKKQRPIPLPAPNSLSDKNSAETRNASGKTSSSSDSWAADISNVPIPLPVRNPKRRPFGSSLGDAEVIAWPTNDIIEAQQFCEKELGDIIMVFDTAPPMRKGACGTPAPIRLKAVGSSPVIHISPPAKVNCKMAKALHHWLTKKVQPAAEKYFKSKIVKIRNLAAYSCRNRYSNPSKKISEHAFANALDIATFITADKQKIDLLKHWGLTRRDIAAKRRKEREKRLAALKRKAEPMGKIIKVKSTTGSSQSGLSTQAIDKTSAKPDNMPKEKPFIPLPALRKEIMTVTVKSKKADFLHQIHADACGIFGTVLGPEANDAHRNHFHVDLAPRRRGSFCE